MLLGGDHFDYQFFVWFEGVDPKCDPNLEKMFREVVHRLEGAQEGWNDVGLGKLVYGMVGASSSGGGVDRGFDCSLDTRSSQLHAAACPACCTAP